MKVPDLLHLEPKLSVDRQLISELLELAFMGKGVSDELDRAFSSYRGSDGDGWQREFFADDLFVEDLVEDCFTLRIDDEDYRVNKPYLVRVLSEPPTSREAIRYRQEIVTELDEQPGLRTNAERLYRHLVGMAGMLRLPGRAAGIDINAFRLDVLRQAKATIDWMVEGFGPARSGLHRLHEVGLEIQSSREYGLLEALLDYEQNLASINVDITVGATGRITALEIHEVVENHRNPFHQSAWKRLAQRLSFLLRGFQWDSYLALGRLVQGVFEEVRPWLVPLLELTGQLELYLASFDFRQRALRSGLEMALARISDEQELELHELFNPLLLRDSIRPVPCSLHGRPEGSVTIVTGPNSGGKTRLLQAVGVAQLLGQSGLFTCAAEASLPVVHGLFVSLVEREGAHQAEGRLGRELQRVRAILDRVQPSSMVVLDELCSGTNPSEGVEVFSVVLRLLERIAPFGFICTHFLDFARSLEEDPPIRDLDFLQVEVDEEQHSTYQFLPGVADTSLAAVLAERMGMTFEAMARGIDERFARFHDRNRERD